MSNSPEPGSIGSSFDIKDYVKATTDAAKRTRTVTIVLVVATVLITIGYYNSLQSSWARQRIKRAFNTSPEVTEAIKKLLDPSGNLDLTTLDPDKKSVIDKYREYFQEATVRAYVENVRFVRVPFFGIAFDVNDLGVIGGVSLVIILLLMRYSLSREIKNLNVSFREAVHHSQLRPFYHALAMRQVFTVPHMKGEARNRVLATAPKFICILPLIFFTLGVTYDYISVAILGQYSFGQVFIPLLLETIWLVVIWVLSLKCWERQSHINSIWDQYWKRMSNQKSSVIRLDKDLVEEFGSDDIVNDALRGNDVLYKPEQESKRSKEQRATAESKLKYIAALLFASIFIASTTALFITYKRFTSGDAGSLPLSPNVPIWINVFTSIVSAIGTIAAIIFAARKDKREQKEKELEDGEKDDEDKENHE